MKKHIYPSSFGTRKKFHTNGKKKSIISQFIKMEIKGIVIIMEVFLTGSF